MGKGVQRSMGATAVLRIGGVDVVTISNRLQTTDLQVFLSQGIDPMRCTVLVVKSIQHFRAAYEINPHESRYRVALRARKPGRLAPLPVFGRAAVSSRKVVTSGDVRFAELLRSDLLDPHGAIEAKKRG